MKGSGNPKVRNKIRRARAPALLRCERGSFSVQKFFSSVRVAVILLVLITIASITGTLIPQSQTAAFYIQKYGTARYALFRTLGLTNLYHTWWFVLLLLLLGLSVCFCSFRRLSRRARDIFFQITHWSIVVILLGGIIGGIWGEKGFIQLHPGEEIDHIQTGRDTVPLGFTVRLDRFTLKRYEDGIKNLILLDREEGLEEAIPAEEGIEWVHPKSEYTLRIVRYVPDFSLDIQTREVTSRSDLPNNPALQVEVAKDGEVNSRWVFARHTHFHDAQDERPALFFHYQVGAVKDYISDVSVIEDGAVVLRKAIEVNDPLKYGGYVFYQTSYDQEGGKWTGLQVKKDPGVPVVYAGFILLSIGLVLQLYVYPVFIKKKV
jgi:hypothetical protein